MKKIWEPTLEEAIVQLEHALNYKNSKDDWSLGERQAYLDILAVLRGDAQILID